MSNPKMQKIGEFTFYQTTVDAMDLIGLPFTGRKLEMDFAQQILLAGGLIYEVIFAEEGSNRTLMDGNKRVLHMLWLCQQTPEFIKEKFPNIPGIENFHPDQYRTIPAKVFVNISPEDQATWSLILNEARSDNLISAWEHVLYLQERGKWEEIRELSRLNKQRFEHFGTLNKLTDRQVWTEAFHKGGITEANLLAVAKMQPERQKLAVGVLTQKQKIVASDIKDIKTASNRQATATMPFQMNVPDRIIQRELYAVVDPKTLNIGGIGNVIADMDGIAKQLANGYKLYRLVEVK